MNNKKSERKAWFQFLKKIIRIFIKKTNFVYLGEEVKDNAIILTNHEGASAPLAYELYYDKPIRFWGASEMNSGLISVYKYQTRIYYHQKKHWNLHLARLFCLIASPLTNLYYRGLNLISTYHDARLRTTFKESVDSLKRGNNIVIFPEKSENGYLQELTGFHGGCIVLLKQCLKNGIDPDVFVAYFKRKDKKCIIDKPIKASELLAMNLKSEEILNMLCDRCNELGKMDVNNE